MTTIRPATTDDVDPMLAIERAVFGRAAWSSEQMADELHRVGETRWYAVALVEERPVGYVGLYLSPPDADVQTIAVAQEEQGAGIGRALLRAAVAHAWDAGCTRMFLEVRADNEAALRLYRAAGFEQLGRRKRYYPDGTDALTMRLRRHQPAALGVTADG